MHIVITMDIQKIIDKYALLGKVIGEKTQEQKVLMCLWKWNYEEGESKIEEIESEIHTYGKKVKRVKIEKSSKTLGVYITLTLIWKSQFEHMKKKLIQEILKLLQIDLNHHQAGVYYNIYMLMSTYFGSRVIDLNEKEENELIKIHEEP